jgi:hypothetical protein
MVYRAVDNRQLLGDILFVEERSMAMLRPPMSLIYDNQASRYLTRVISKSVTVKGHLYVTILMTRIGLPKGRTLQFLAIVRLSLKTCRNVRCTAYDSSRLISQSCRSGLIKATHFVDKG